MSSDKPWALRGIRVIDLTWIQVGPQTTRLLASFGAEIIRVESPLPAGMDIVRQVPPFAPNHATPDGGRCQGAASSTGIKGNYNRSALFNNTNAGKYSITLNLNHPKGRELLKRLVADANVLCENFSPRQMEKWNLSYDDLRKLNPKLIYLQVTGMGKAGVYSDFASYGPTAQALSGLTYMSGLPEQSLPAGWGYSYLDHSPGYFGAFLLMSALRRQRQSGLGCYIDMSQAETGLMLTGTALLEHQVTTRPTRRYGNRMPYRDWAPYGAFRCAGDDNWITIAIRSDEDWRALVEEMGSPQWASDRKFATAAGRKAHEDELDRQLTSFTTAQERYDLMKRLQHRGIAAGVVQKASDRVDLDPQLKARGFFVDLPSSEIGTWPVDGFPAKLSRSPAYVGGLPGRSAPKIGEDNDRIYREVTGLSDAEITALREEGVI